jgi:hypothetical protein
MLFENRSERLPSIQDPLMLLRSFISPATLSRSLFRAQPIAARYRSSAAASTSPSPKVTVWFDSDCTFDISPALLKSMTTEVEIFSSLSVGPLCIREIALFRRLDSHRLQPAIDFVDLASPNITLPNAPPPPASSSLPEQPVTSPCPISKRDLLRRFHARDESEPNAQVVSGAAAFAKMWKVLPREAFLGNILSRLGELAERRKGVMWGLEKSYVGFLKVRPSVQRLVRKLVD